MSVMPYLLNVSAENVFVVAMFKFPRVVVI
jgi:hypothetical protein